jgi:hypothetical protein
MSKMFENCCNRSKSLASQRETVNNSTLGELPSTSLQESLNFSVSDISNKFRSNNKRLSEEDSSPGKKARRETASIGYYHLFFPIW